jgi:hypothetical protein
MNAPALPKMPNSNFSFEDNDNFGEEEKQGSVHSFPNIAKSLNFADTPPPTPHTPIGPRPDTRRNPHKGGSKKSRKSKKKTIRKRR